MRGPRYWFAYAWWRVRMWFHAHAVTLALVLLVLTAGVIYLLPDIIVTIASGESGVLWQRFDGGTVTVDDRGRPFRGRIATDRAGEPTALDEQIHEHDDEVDELGFETWPYSEGLHWKWPWDRIFIYNIRLQQVSATYDALTNDGLSVNVEVTIRWKPIEEDLGKLHRDIGPDYVQTLLVPLVGSFARQEIASYRPEALYSPDRLGIQENIRQKTKDALISRFHPEEHRESYLLLEDILIRNIDLPPTVEEAIQNKVVEKHLAEAYEHRLERERQEAERKAIEADGIRRFQETINATISDGYLKWKGIDATLELAKSSNAKVVVIGAGEDGLPIILGGLEGVAPPAVAGAVTPPPAPAPVPGSPAPPASPTAESTPAPQNAARPPEAPSAAPTAPGPASNPASSPGPAPAAAPPSASR
ncbi:MAG: prohibitin family protein [Acidimicrobiia bacterium]|nr:prohibitin family protein [Acidimicrobiia bacterium]